MVPTFQAEHGYPMYFVWANDKRSALKIRTRFLAFSEPHTRTLVVLNALACLYEKIAEDSSKYVERWVSSALQKAGVSRVPWHCVKLVPEQQGHLCSCTGHHDKKKVST